MINCKACSREKTVALCHGQSVCTYCPDWLIECEARYLLAMPLSKRRQELLVRHQKRGNIEPLKEVMAHIHAIKKR